MRRSQKYKIFEICPIFAVCMGTWKFGFFNVLFEITSIILEVAL
jgi:hypothetical protein